MQPAATFTTASVGCSMTGSGTSYTRMSPGPWMVVARMDGILAASAWRALTAPAHAGRWFAVSHI